MAGKKKADPFKFLDRLNDPAAAPNHDDARVKKKSGGRVTSDEPADEKVPDLTTLNPDLAVSIDPSTITAWRFANRMYFDPDTLNAIKDSIAASNQHQPALVRPLDPSDDRSEGGRYSYELIYGAQRWRAVSELGINLRAVVADIGDREAVLAMDAENRARADITVYERACDYARWLSSGLFNSAADICKASGSTRATVSRLLKIAELPEEVPKAFSSYADLSFSYGYDLASAMGTSDAKRAALIDAAEQLRGVPGDELNVESRKKRLMTAVRDGGEKPSKVSTQAGFSIDPIKLKDEQGKPLARVSVTRLGEVKVQTRQLDDESQARSVTEALREALSEVLK